MHRHLSDHSIIDSVLSRRLRSVCGAYNWILFRKPNKNCRKTGRQIPVFSAAVLWLIMRHNRRKLWTKLGCLVRLPEKICHCATKQSRLQGAKLQWSKPWCFWNKAPRESAGAKMHGSCLSTTVKIREKRAAKRTLVSLDLTRTLLILKCSTSLSHRQVST